MPKAVTLFVNDFFPDAEGVAKSAHLLWAHLSQRAELQVTLHALTSRLGVRSAAGSVAYSLCRLPVGLWMTKRLERRSDMSHVVGSLTGRLYLTLLTKAPLLVTNAAGLQDSKLEGARKQWRKVTMAVVECRRDQQRIMAQGMTPERVALIYPAVEISVFTVAAPPSQEPFRIGFASAPIGRDPRGVRSRGLDLLLAAADRLPDVEFVLLWRGKHLGALHALMQRSTRRNVTIINRILPDMNAFYRDVHCTILPSRSLEDCKPCPHSIMESLAAGKPVLVSRAVGVADLIREEGCGLVAEPDVDDIVANLTRMQAEYGTLQPNARRTAERHFSVPRFINAYAALYDRLLGG